MVWKVRILKKKIEAITDQLKEYSPDLELWKTDEQIFRSPLQVSPFIESGIEPSLWQYPLYQKQLQKTQWRDLERSNRQEPETATKSSSDSENMEITNEVQVDKHFRL